jgi:hypothetical protein
MCLVQFYGGKERGEDESKISPNSKSLKTKMMNLRTNSQHVS